MAAAAPEVNLAAENARLESKRISDMKVGDTYYGWELIKMDEFKDKMRSFKTINYKLDKILELQAGVSLQDDINSLQEQINALTVTNVALIVGVTYITIFTLKPFISKLLKEVRHSEQMQIVKSKVMSRFTPIH
jgi:hypothetical protein